MADDLDLEVLSIKGEGPSPDFVANLRERVAAEIAKSAIAPDDELVIAVNLRPNDKEQAVAKTRLILAGVAAAIILISGFAVLSGDEEDKLETLSEPEQSTPTVTTPTVTTTIVTAAAEPATFVRDASTLTREFSSLEAGTYRVDTLGTAFSFTSEEPLFVQSNRALFVLSDPTSQGPDDRDIVFMRLSALSDPVQPGAPFEGQAAGRPPEDFAGWLDNLADGVVASNRQETTLGGLVASRVDLEVELSACGDDPQVCVNFGTNELVESKSLNPGAEYRIWVVEQEDQAPLAVIVGIRSETQSEWFDTAQGILSTLAFGDIAPNPILRFPAGPAEVPLLGGIRIEPKADITVTQETGNFGRILLEGQPADTEFLTNPVDLDGNILETTEGLVALLVQSNTEVTETEPVTIGGIEARVFDIGGRTSQILLRRNPEDERGWWAPPLGQIWLLEHPERGLLMINAEAWDDLETAFPLIVTQTEEILESLEFIELS
ncbi:MAG: hypothetical protein V3V01_08080 [Acidimicrobiales bacterium]